MSDSEAIRVEFSSESSGAYIHEMTDDVTLNFTDHSLRVHRNDDSVSIDLTYADGSLMTLESIVDRKN